MQPFLRSQTVTIPAGQTLDVAAFGNDVSIRNASGDFELSFDGEHFVPMCAGIRIETRATFDKLTLKNTSASAITVVLGFGQVGVHDETAALAAVADALAESNATLLAIRAEIATRRYVDLPSGTNKALATDTNYSGTINANATFTLPTVSDGKPHEIWLSLVITGTPTINWGTTKGLYEAPPATPAAGSYAVGWLWQQAASAWVLSLAKIA